MKSTKGLSEEKHKSLYHPSELEMCYSKAKYTEVLTEANILRY